MATREEISNAIRSAKSALTEAGGRYSDAQPAEDPTPVIDALEDALHNIREVLYELRKARSDARGGSSK